MLVGLAWIALTICFRGGKEEGGAWLVHGSPMYQGENNTTRADKGAIMFVAATLLVLFSLVVAFNNIPPMAPA